MKIIFDSEEQKEMVFDKLVTQMCPEEFGLENHCPQEDCENCWAKSGIEMEVKGA